MQLIRRIEIAYFRSVYKESIDAPQGTNVLFGRNDAGKSNVLRALNLFFNGQTNPGLPFSFDRDFCHARLAEADPKRNIRKFVYVKLWFNTPSSYRPSLGGEFWVRKQWSVTRPRDPIVSHSIGLGKDQYVTRFLNKVRFFYIPAIKDRSIFEQLLAQIYRVVASQKEFSSSLANFAGALRERTEDLTEGLLAGLSVESVISPPDDLTDLFRSLDFETNTEGGDSYSLTLQRGDGIQVRHIPAILAFLSDRGAQDYYVWGFEEPENSLELANAIEEADVLCQFGQERNKQIFLTSHSPAFFALDDSSVARFFVSRSEEHSGRLTSKIRTISIGEADLPGELMGETPHLPVISHYLTTAHASIQKLQEQSEELFQALDSRDRTIVFVEGDSDARVLEAAWDALVGEDRDFSFESAGGTTKMESLARDGKVLDRVAPGRNVLALVDNDGDGRRLYKSARLGEGGRWVQHNGNGVWWCRLPFTKDLRAVFTDVGMPSEYWPGTLENLFSADLRSEAADAGVYSPSEFPYSELLNPQAYPKIHEYVLPSEDDRRLYVLAPDSDLKLSFADWVVDRSAGEPSILEPLRPVLEGLSEVLERLESGSAS